MSILFLLKDTTLITAVVILFIAILFLFYILKKIKEYKEKTIIEEVVGKEKEEKVVPTQIPKNADILLAQMKDISEQISLLNTKIDKIQEIVQEISKNTPQLSITGKQISQLTEILSSLKESSSQIQLEEINAKLSTICKILSNLSEST